MLGQTARFQRYAAELLYVIAADRKIDPDRMPRFAEQVDEIYKNPFGETAKTKKMSADEIKQHIWNKLEEAKQWI